tara:strand:- start:250 stop:549 length:300 start_codon:yes stop_codon:yes gene_type:complete
VSIKSLGVKLMFDISMELSTKKLLEKSRGFFVLLKLKQVSTYREVQKIPKSVLRFYFSLGCSPLWPISEQRGEMNPTSATKTIKRLYFYKVWPFFYIYI